MAPADSRPGQIYSRVLVSDNLPSSAYGLGVLFCFVLFPTIKMKFASIFPAQLKPREASDLRRSRFRARYDIIFYEQSALNLDVPGGFYNLYSVLVWENLHLEWSHLDKRNQN